MGLDNSKSKKVNIILSSYNGEKYIHEQIESLLEQDYDNLEIHIRDDGSSDQTRDILKEYQENNKEKIFVYFGDNVGYKKSFQWLIQNCGNADYFAFCDQDDHWYPGKISRAVACLEKKEMDVPGVYLCDFFWCDAKMNREYKSEAYKKKHSLEKYVTFGDRNAFGFTEVFNKRAADAVKDKKCFTQCSHDKIVYMYCLCNGYTIWDDQVEADYRRHGGNASSLELVGGNKWSHFLWRVKTFLLNSKREEMYTRMRAFYDSFQDEMDSYTRNVYRLYLGNKGNVKKMFYPVRYRDSFMDEIAIRILFLLGRV